MCGGGGCYQSKKMWGGGLKIEDEHATSETDGVDVGEKGRNRDELTEPSIESSLLLVIRRHNVIFSILKCRIVGSFVPISCCALSRQGNGKKAKLLNGTLMTRCKRRWRVSLSLSFY